MTRELIENCLAITPSIVSIGVVTGRPDIGSWVERDNGDMCLFVSVGGNEPQRIPLEEFFSPIIDRMYFRCECGHRVFKLYLPPNQSVFTCRHKLRYALSAFNPNTKHGRARYQFLRLDKLSEERMRIRTPIYRGKWSRRFQRFLRMCERAGLNEVVEDAKKLMETIKASPPVSTI